MTTLVGHTHQRVAAFSLRNTKRKYNCKLLRLLSPSLPCVTLSGWILTTAIRAVTGQRSRELPRSLWLRFLAAQFFLAAGGMEGFSFQNEKLGSKSEALGLSLEVGASCLLLLGGERLGAGRPVSCEAGLQAVWVALYVPGREGEGGSGFPGCSPGLGTTVREERSVSGSWGRASCLGLLGDFLPEKP